MLCNIKKLIPPKTSGTLVIDTQKYIKSFKTVFIKIGIQIKLEISNSYKNNTVQVSIPEKAKTYALQLSDYQYFEELILDIIRKNFKTPQIELLSSDFYVNPNINRLCSAGYSFSNV